MTNGNDSAFQNQTFSPNSDAGFRESEALTKREYFAAMALQGLATMDFMDHFADPTSDSPTTTRYQYMANDAVKIADALIEALNK